MTESQPSQTSEEKLEATIHLDQFLKTCGVATGGQAKRLIQGGEILVNGEVETRRRKQLRVGDEVDWDGIVYVVSWGGDDQDAEEADSDVDADGTEEANATEEANGNEEANANEKTDSTEEA